MEVKQDIRPEWLTLAEGEAFLAGFKMSPGLWSWSFYIAGLFSVLGSIIIAMLLGGMSPATAYGIHWVYSVSYLLFVIVYGYVPLVFLSVLRWKWNFYIAYLTSRKIVIGVASCPIFKFQFREFDLSRLESVVGATKWQYGNVVVLFSGARRKIRINLHLRDRDDFIASIKSAAPHIEQPENP